MELTETQSNSFPVVVLVSSSSNSRLNLCLNQWRTFWAFWSSLNRNWNRRFRARQLSLLGMSLLCRASTKLCNTHHQLYTVFNPEVWQRLWSSHMWHAVQQTGINILWQPTTSICNPEEGGSRFLWNNVNLIWNYTASHSRTTIILIITAIKISPHLYYDASNHFK